MSVYCGSRAAIEAAAVAYPGNDAGLLADALIAAHHPALGLDRSVCLRDVIDLLEQRYHPQLDKVAAELTDHPADYVERHFAAAPSDDAAPPDAAPANQMGQRSGEHRKEPS